MALTGNLKTINLHLVSQLIKHQCMGCTYKIITINNPWEL